VLSSYLATANVLLALDKSGTMTLSDGTTATRWGDLTAAVPAALSDFAGVLRLGLEFFPAATVALTCQATLTNNQCCVMPEVTSPLTVPVQAGTLALSAIQNALSTVSPGGGTPMAAALERAYHYYTGEGSALTGDKYVLLVTDGGPNCNTELTTECPADHCTRNLDGNLAVCPPSGTISCCNSPVLYSACLDDTRVADRISQLRLAGIRTIVVGLPGSAPYAAYLDVFATAGGMASGAYLATDGANLTSILRSIMASLAPDCQITLDAPPPDITRTNVLVDCAPVTSTTTDADGSWTYDPASVSVMLTGAVCDAIRSQGVQRIDVVTGCPTAQ
jgi:hypothetical protein